MSFYSNERSRSERFLCPWGPPHTDADGYCCPAMGDQHGHDPTSIGYVARMKLLEQSIEYCSQDPYYDVPGDIELRYPVEIGNARAMGKRKLWAPTPVVLPVKKLSLWGRITQ